MSFLSISSYIIKYRGYEYYNEGRVLTYNKLSDYEYTGDVVGSQLYHVKINLRHPKKSTCTCPYVDGSRICKHMIALLFTVSDDDLRKYEMNYYDEYEDEDDYDFYDDYEDDDYEMDDKYVKPIFFDEILEKYVNKLSKKELKEILIEELGKDEEYAFEKYLKEEYNDFILQGNNKKVILEKINIRFNELKGKYRDTSNNFEEVLLSEKEKNVIKELINKSEEMKERINKVLLIPELSVYDDYKWIAKFYKENNSKEEVKKYTEKLMWVLYRLKDSYLCSNILITVYILNDYSIKEEAKLLIEYYKYNDFINYVIENHKECQKLYNETNKIISKADNLKNEYLASIYYNFNEVLHDEKVYGKFVYYSFLYTKDEIYLNYLKETKYFKSYIDKIINEVDDVIAKEKVYLYLNKKEELLQLVMNEKNEMRLIANIFNLREEYSDEILSYLIKRFYEIVDLFYDRKSYRKASMYIIAMGKLKDGEKIISNFIEKLKKSNYSRRESLFNEIDIALKKNKINIVEKHE